MSLARTSLCTVVMQFQTSAKADGAELLRAGRFDVALEQGLGELLVDYVVEVCSDPFLTSADPVDAYLMDGRCMQQWAHRALRSSRARLLQVCTPLLCTPICAELGSTRS